MVQTLEEKKAKARKPNKQATWQKQKRVEINLKTKQNFVHKHPNTRQETENF